MGKIRIELSAYDTFYAVELSDESPVHKVMAEMCKLLRSSGYTEQSIIELFKENENPFEWDFIE